MKKCECGRYMNPIDHDDDRNYYEERCSDCDEKRIQIIKEAGQLFAKCNESESFMVIAMGTKRLEYLRGEELKRLAGIHAN